MKLWEEKILMEMSRVANVREMDASIWVHPSSNRSGPYFKVYNSLSQTKATKCARIRFDIPKYEIHKATSKGSWELNTSEIKELMQFFNTKYNGFEYTNWDRCKWIWNDEIYSNMGVMLESFDYFSGKCDIDMDREKNKNYLRLDFGMPNYLELR